MGKWTPKQRKNFEAAVAARKAAGLKGNAKIRETSTERVTTSIPLDAIVGKLKPVKKVKGAAPAPKATQDLQLIARIIVAVAKELSRG